MTPSPRSDTWAPNRPPTAGPLRSDGKAAGHERQAVSLFRRDIAVRALLDSVKKLDPRVQIHNPVTFVVEIGSVITP
jgi:K+-transporting ATPase ATPase B chain